MVWLQVQVRVAQLQAPFGCIYERRVKRHPVESPSTCREHPKPRELTARILSEAFRIGEVLRRYGEIVPQASTRGIADRSPALFRPGSDPLNADVAYEKGDTGRSSITPSSSMSTFSL